MMTRLTAFLLLLPLECFAAGMTWEHAGSLDWDHQDVAATTVPDPLEKALAESVKTGKGIILWVGGNFCDRCVEDSKGEFVHVFADEWKGQPGPATVLMAPHDGTVYRVATVNRWTVGSSDWGHIPSARRLFREWGAQAQQGSLAPLRLLDLNGTGEAWGMSHDAFWGSYRGGGGSARSGWSSSVMPRRATSFSGNC